MRKSYGAAALAAILATAGVARADEAAANRLLVEAIELAEQAARAPRDEAVSLYSQAVANLDAIVAEHPETSYAVLIATNQPIGAFRTWEVRHELARLTQVVDVPPVQQPVAVEPWERQFGDGNANVLTGDSAHFMSDLIARADGSVIVVANHWHDRSREIWLAAYSPDGEPLWENSYPGMPCGAAPIEDGFVVLGGDVVQAADYGVLMLLEDGSAPTALPIDFDPYAVAPDGSGGFVVVGTRDTLPIVERYRADGDLTWTWSTAEVFEVGMDSGGVVAAVAAQDSDELKILGFTDGSADGGSRLSMWLATLSADGVLTDQTTLGEVGRPSLVACDPVLTLWSIDQTADGFLVRYADLDPAIGYLRSTMMLVDPAGQALWRQVHPIDPQSQPDPQAAIEAGVDEISASAATSDGGVLVAGYRNRPMGQGGAFVTRWDPTGALLWSTELRRPDDDGRVADAYFGAISETADGGIIAVMTDGVRYLRPRAFIFRLAPDGTAP